MKRVISSSGLGTGRAEATEPRPKPMIEIGGRAILWHIMKHYAYDAVKEFYLALAHRRELIKRFFIDYSNLGWSLRLDLTTRKTDKHDRTCGDPFAMQ